MAARASGRVSGENSPPPATYPAISPSASIGYGRSRTRRPIASITSPHSPGCSSAMRPPDRGSRCFDKLRIGRGAC